MPMQSNELNFKGQNIYVGIDVHLKSWTVSILTEKLHHKTFSQPPSVEALSGYLHQHFPGGCYRSVYEAGFSGFWAHCQLEQEGISNIVVNPADVPTSQKESLGKTDSVDSRKLARSERYVQDYGLLRSVPGIGAITALSLLVEVEDIRRFQNSDKLAGYIGLVPTTHSSGEKDNKGEMTFRGQMKLRSKIIESAWFAARIDPAMSMAFLELTKRMEGNKAIVRIARKLLNRVFYVLKYKKRYECAIVK